VPGILLVRLECKQVNEGGENHHLARFGWMVIAAVGRNSRSCTTSLAPSHVRDSMQPDIPPVMLEAAENTGTVEHDARA
jgi:hypothetical protein